MISFTITAYHFCFVVTVFYKEFNFIACIYYTFLIFNYDYLVKYIFAIIHLFIFSRVYYYIFNKMFQNLQKINSIQSINIIYKLILLHLIYHCAEILILNSRYSSVDERICKSSFGN